MTELILFHQPIMADKVISIDRNSMFNDIYAEGIRGPYNLEFYNRYMPDVNKNPMII